MTQHYSPSSLLRELIDLPERVDASDFVIKLAEGVSRHEQTVRDYVVTEAIGASIGEALDLVSSALRQQSSRGAFLDGSFGAGKSHFMAVLHLLLSGNLAARRIDGLGDVIARRHDVLERNLLVLDYNLLGAKSFEDAVFGGYLATIENRHPDAPTPILHASDRLLEDAARQRAREGDEAFFAGLGGIDDGWGDLAAGWDASTFEAAASSPPGSPDRDRLVGDLITNYFTGYTSVGEWLPMDQGLHSLTTHARTLGYQGVVFLVDEIVLWLGQRLGDTAWVQTEVEKVVQLAENAAANLPIPITSFLARQRDLRDFIGGSVSGAERVARGQLFSYWEDRFSKIKLQAADLPKIVKQRLLQPRDGDAAATLASAVAEIKRDHAAWGYLLSDDANADERAFADVYPFSPALVDTMIALSSLMQRERTALKLMAELLSEGRDALRVRDVIPVGDVYEPIVLGTSRPLSDDMKQHFDISARFYRQKMLPHLLRKHGLAESEVPALDRHHAFVTEDRLAKTVLIAALAPEAKSLANLTAAKLAALNWGTIDAFIPGAETEEVLTIVRSWATEFGEITVGDGSDPIITATLSGVDYDSILDRVRTEDNAQTRRELISKLIVDELGLSDSSLEGRRISHVWRGRKRTAMVRFGNVRDPEEVFEHDLVHAGPEWRAVIDFPYDQGGHSPADDVARLRQLTDSGSKANTIAWIPNFLTDARRADLGKLVQLEFLLTGNRFDSNADHMAVADRGPARQTLESQRRSLRDLLIATLRQAYGVIPAEETNVGNRLTGDEIFSTLAPGLTIAPPPSGTLLSGFRHALEAAWNYEYPEHPDLGTEEVSKRRLDEAVDLAASTIEAGGRRQGLSPAEQRTARDIITPLGLGELNENVLVVDPARFRWRQDFSRWEGELGNDLTVGALRTKLSSVGMSREMEDVVIIGWALLGGYEFPGIARPAVGAIADGIAPRKANLPTPDDWGVALERAAGVFGVAPETSLTPRALGRFATAVRAHAQSPAIPELVAALEEHAVDLGLDADAPIGRLATARRVSGLLGEIGRAHGDRELVQTLASFDLPDQLSALGTTVASAERIGDDLRGLDWDMFRAAQTHGDAEFASALAALQEAASDDESIVALEPRLRVVGKRARELLIQQRRAAPPQPAPHVPDASEPEDHEDSGPVTQTRSGSVKELARILEDVKTAIEQHAPGEGTVTVRWQVD